MNPSIQRKLERLAERHAEITALLAEPEVQADPARFRALGQEYAQLEPLALAFGDYQRTEDDLAAAEALLADSEMADLAREEIDAARERRLTLEPELLRLLIPADPHDQANVFLEVRAGTGGAEAALFAADLLRMYLRYAELRGWRTEQISASEGELGGFKEVVARLSGSGVYSRLKFESGAHRVQRAQKQLEAAAIEFRKDNLDTTALLVQGAVAESILREADRLHADAILMGVHARGLGHESFIGGTARQVVSQSTRPVILVPAPVAAP